jgi:hypothetical protein
MKYEVVEVPSLSRVKTPNPHMETIANMVDDILSGGAVQAKAFLIPRGADQDAGAHVKDVNRHRRWLSEAGEARFVTIRVSLTSVDTGTKLTFWVHTNVSDAGLYLPAKIVKPAGSRVKPAVSRKVRDASARLTHVLEDGETSE